MGYRNLGQCINDLQETGQLVRLEEEVDPFLEAAHIQRRLYAAGGPAVYFARVKGCRFPMVGNLFGTIERARFLFRDTLDAVRRLVELRIDPSDSWKKPRQLGGLLRSLWHMRPKTVSRGAVLQRRTSIDQLPRLVSWPKDGGPFITLPEVYTEDPDRPGLRHSNLGMYRIQLLGNRYEPNRQVGLHYQIHRSIGVHHAAAVRRGEPLRVNVFVGGAPAMILAAVMPLPEGLSELMFAGALGGHRVPMIRPGTASRVNRPDQVDGESRGSLPIYAEADFCITGTADPDLLLPEGPFGDHLGYYSLAHDFPVLNVEAVYHRQGAVWPFTSVGRPPQEDTSFGRLIHEITGPAIPNVVPGVHAVHAVDAAGVHPLLLAVGSERYVPYGERRKPQEILTSANGLLGQGQLSLAKYLFIVAGEDDPSLDVHDIPGFFAHVLRRVDWRRDLHFQTCTTIDTLDYSGTALNEGSKVVVAAAGPVLRELATEIPSELNLPSGYREPRVCLPGVLVIQAPPWSEGRRNRPAGTHAETAASGLDQTSGADCDIEEFCRLHDVKHPINRFPLIVLVDDSRFAADSLRNFLWVTFTRSDPASDVYGIESFVHQKHWGCRGSVVIDARLKPHHAPPLEDDPEITKRVDRLGAPGGPLHGMI